MPQGLAHHSAPRIYCLIHPRTNFQYKVNQTGWWLSKLGLSTREEVAGIGKTYLQGDLQLLLGKPLFQGAIQLAHKPLHWTHMDHDGTAPHINTSLAEVLMRDLLRTLGPFSLCLIPMLCQSLPCNLQATHKP